jgi:glyoxylase-like metal-dependent hydrolase (beta-lactamase superfamily II)
MLRALLLSSLAAAASAADTDPGFTATRISGSVSVLQGHECNVTVSAADDGVILVDTCVAEVADKLLAAVRRHSGKPLLYVIDTHAHADHSGGNATFQKFAPVIAHHTVRTRLAEGNKVTGDQPRPPEALPAITFDRELVLHFNGDDIRLLKLPPGHTDGDVVVFFAKANVVCVGDVFMSPAASFGDRHYGGGMSQLIESLEFLLPQIPSDARVVPGHGSISTRADVAAGLEVLKQMKTVVEAAVRDGKTLEQLTAERPFDKWRNSVPAWMSSDKALDGLVRRFHREIAPPPPAN